jgi:AcrR family transcriptional regulator
VKTATESRVDTPHDDAMRRQILDAAMECFSRIGIAKTSIQDIARVAEVSRGTVYRYFKDRQTLVDAGVEFGAARYYEDAAKAMGKKATLDEQVAAFATVVVKTLLEHRTRDRLMDGDATLMRLIVSDRAKTLERHAAFLRPYIEAAQDRGEIDATIDIDEAAEWLARTIMSLSMIQTSLTADFDKPSSVGNYVGRFAVGGLTGA